MVYVTAPKVIPSSGNIPQVVMASRGPSALPNHQHVGAEFDDEVALPTRVGGDTDGLFVLKDGNSRESLGVLEGPAGVEEIGSGQKQTNREHSVCDTAISVYKEVFNKDAMEGPVKCVGKVEPHVEKVGKVEPHVEKVGKVEPHVEKVGKVEGMGTNVGKSEGSIGKVGKTVGKSEEDTVGKVEQMGNSVGKSEENSVGKTEETGISPAKVEGEGETVGKSVGKAENGNEDENVGKLRKATGTGKAVGKVEGDEGKVIGKSVSKAEEGDVGKASKESVGKDEESKVSGIAMAKGGGVTAKLAGKTEGVGKDDRNMGKLEESTKQERECAGQKSLGHEVGKTGASVQNQSVGKISNEKEDSQEYVIAVAGKSESEMSYVEALTTGAAEELKLPKGATLEAYQQATPIEDGFRVGVFMDQLMTRQFGRLLLYARQLPSTHTLLSQNLSRIYKTRSLVYNVLAESAVFVHNALSWWVDRNYKTLPVGTLSVVDVQFHGKGRAGNSWESPKGCLMFSFTVQMSDGRAVPFLQYVVSLAVIEGIEHLCISKGLKAPEVRIKWPNDLYAKGLKVGGVLCTSTYSSKKFNIVVGVGLNVGNRQPTTCLDALLEEINEEAPCLPKDELLVAIMTKFENIFEVFCSKGVFALESDYYKRWLHSGQTVVLEEKQEGSSEVSHVPLKIQGLTPAGYLRAVDDASETYELHPDGNSFDFLKGLVRKKM